MSKLPPYPDFYLLVCAYHSCGQVKCHLCEERRNPDCRACLGTGWLRPCHRCAVTGSVDTYHGRRECLVCDGNGYTAGNSSDREMEFGARAFSGADRGHTGLGGSS